LRSFKQGEISDKEKRSGTNQPSTIKVASKTFFSLRDHLLIQAVRSLAARGDVQSVLHMRGSASGQLHFNLELLAPWKTSAS